MISQRTSAGLAAAKERDVKLGNPAQAEANKAAAQARAADLEPFLRKHADPSDRALAAALAKQGTVITTTYSAHKPKAILSLAAMII